MVGVIGFEVQRAELANNSNVNKALGSIESRIDSNEKYHPAKINSGGSLRLKVN